MGGKGYHYPQAFFPGKNSINIRKGIKTTQLKIDKDYDVLENYKAQAWELVAVGLDYFLIQKKEVVK